MDEYSEFVGMTVFSSPSSSLAMTAEETHRTSLRPYGGVADGEKKRSGWHQARDRK